MIPLGSGVSWPVQSIESDRSLVLGIGDTGVHVSWSIILDQIDERHTRLVLRVRGRLTMTPLLLATLPISNPGEFIMVRGMLLGIKRGQRQLRGSARWEALENLPPRPSR